MWQADLFAAPGSPTGVGKLLRCLPWKNPPPAFALPRARLVRCVRISAGVGRTDSHAPPGGAPRNCVSLSREPPLVLLFTNPGGPDEQRLLFLTVSSPL